jgi:methyltransferase-like protein
LATSVSRQDGPYGMMLKEEVELLRNKSDSYLFHEHLEPSNEPLYFHQFVGRAAAADLRFLGEAEPSSMASFSFPEEVRQTLRGLSADLLQSEQYLDFLHNRTFRQSLLCHSSVTPRHAIQPERAALFHFASSLHPEEGDPDTTSAAPVKFEGRGGISITTEDPLVKTALVLLREAWPGWVAFDLLLDEARSRLEGAGGTIGTREEDRSLLGGRLLTYYLAGHFVEVHATTPSFAVAYGKRPEASAVARYQARKGRFVTSLRHEVVQLSDAEGQLLTLLDGTRARSDLAEELVRLVDAGTLTPQRDRQPVTDPAEVREVVTNALEGMLQRLANNALLVG